MLSNNIFGSENKGLYQYLTIPEFSRMSGLINNLSMVRIVDNILFKNANNIQWTCNKRFFLSLLLGKIKEASSSISVMLMSSELVWVTFSSSFNFDKTCSWNFFRSTVAPSINRAQSYNVLTGSFTEVLLGIFKSLAVDSIFDDGPCIWYFVTQCKSGIKRFKSLFPTRLAAFALT